jgi:hypothetical protein
VEKDPTIGKGEADLAGNEKGVIWSRHARNLLAGIVGVTGFAGEMRIDSSRKGGKAGRRVSDRPHDDSPYGVGSTRFRKR